MNASQLIDEINELSDELEPNNIVLGFINDAIAKINIECDADFPFIRIDELNDDIDFIPEKWLRTLIIPFGVGRIKQRDSSQFEYTDAYTEFMENLEDFRNKVEIPEEYKDESTQGSSIESSIYNEPPYPWCRGW